MSPSRRSTRSAIKPATSSPGTISGRPSTAISCTVATSRTVGQDQSVPKTLPAPVSELFDPSSWTEVAGFDFTDITYHRALEQGTVRIAFHRPEVRNAFRPHTVDELYRALEHARASTD